MRVLLVSTDVEMTEAFVRVLEQRGHEVTVLGDAEAAATVSEQGPLPVQVLVDAELPGGGALALCRRLRTGAQAHSLAVLALVSRRQPDDALALLEAGADDFIPKSVDPKLLAARIAVCERALAGEIALRESEERFRWLAEAGFEGIAIHARGRVIDVNQSLAAMFGYGRAEAIGRLAFDFVAPESHELVRDRLQTDDGQPYEARGLRKDGSTFPMEVCGKTMPYRGRRVRVTAVRDLSRRKHAEEAFARVFHGSPIGITITTLEDGRFVDANEAALEMLGYRRDQIIGRTVRELGIWAAMGDREPAIGQLRAGQSVRGHEGRFRQRSGELRDGMSFLERIEFEGRPCVLALWMDVTEQKRLAEELRHAQKMEAIGRLAGGVAHDFNNITTAIVGYCELLLSRLAQDTLEQRYALSILRVATRAAGLTGQLLAFSRKQVLAPKVIDLNRIVIGLGDMLRRLIGEHIELSVEAAPDLGAVEADPGQIEQVIVNLAVNARDAMPRGGRLTVRTSNWDVDAADAQSHAELPAGRYVTIEVLDTGHGIEPDTRARIFEPFFTTKREGEGTGLGLSTAYGITKQSGGTILVESGAGQGARFTIYLPRVEGVAAAPTATTTATAPATVTCGAASATMALAAGSPTGAGSPAASSAGTGSATGSSHGSRGRETILVAEDEEDVRFITRAMLESQGYRVLMASSGAEAVHMADQYAGPIHLLLTDVVMPGMDGHDTARHLIEKHEHMKVVYMSAYPRDDIVGKGVLDPGTNFLPKPFTTHELVQKVRAVLDAERPGA
ncbi:MAG TPA: PAS domain S-box protein [Polyangia bacterium]|nr:PAS domain S-box protein [Polyangia bacterium]